MRYQNLKKSLGQHFLINQGVCEKILALLDVRREDQVLEIGPGAGALSSLLLQKPCGPLLFVEKDGSWARRLDLQIKEAGVSHARVLEMDALDFSWASLPGQWKLVGNLPYNVASPLIWDIASAAPFSRAVFMVQLEVAERLSASPGSRLYGALSAWVQSFAQVKKNFKVSPGSFSPPPKVDSGVVSLYPRLERPEAPAKLAALLKICFQQRRKQLGRIIKTSGLPRMEQGLEALGLDPALRPEALSPADFAKLSLWMP